MGNYVVFACLHNSILMNKMKAIFHGGNMSLKARSFFCLWVLLFGFSFASFYSPPTLSASETQNEPIAIGTFDGMISSLLYLAKMQGYFEEQGLNVEIQGYQAGKYAMENFLKGKIQIAASSDFVFALKSFDKTNLKILASICEADTNFMIARSDRGISKPSDIAGKKVGLTMGSVSEFFLGDFLTAHNLSFKDIEVVNLKPKEIVTQMSDGTLDVALSWAYYVFKLHQTLGSKISTWSLEQDQSLYFVLFTDEAWLNKNARVADKIMIALARAEAYLRSNTTRAKKEIREKFNYSKAYMKWEWPHFICSLTLSQGLLTTLSAQAEWLRFKNRVKNRATPDYMKMIYMRGLEQAKPDAITIIR